MSVLSVYFLIMALCNFFDAKFGRRENMEDSVRKKYRRWASLAYLYLSFATAGIFIADTFWRIDVGFVKIIAIYAVPLLYLVFINKKFSAK